MSKENKILKTISIIFKAFELFVGIYCLIMTLYSKDIFTFIKYAFFSTILLYSEITRRI
jgi:hypothetical protein